MSFSLVYLAHRLGYRLWMFVYGWYVGGFRAIGGRVIGMLESMDRTWAFRITLRNLFKPLYQDQSFLGRILGFFFRSARLLISGFIYALVIIVGVAVYIGWASVPIYILAKGFLLHYGE
jgi:hypothetical protein